MNCKIYVTDEGYGPLVRQSAVVDAFRVLDGDIQFTLQTQKHAEAAKWILEDINVVERYNNISWAKHRDGTPDLPKIELFFSDYLIRSDEFVREELKSFDYDFVISDFVYEAFHVACKNNAPAFGISHFTWDWFFSKMFPIPVPTLVLERFFTCAKSADVLYFPPFTPQEQLRYYGGVAKQVPFIVRGPKTRRDVGHDDRFKVLIMDSGSGVLGRPIQSALANMRGLSDFHFFLSEKFRYEADNVTFMKTDELFLDYFPHMDLVVSRAGFNTMSECIACRTPMLLVGEAMNPEIDVNMLSIKRCGLGSFVSMEDFTGNLEATLAGFVSYEYEGIRRRMESHEFRCDGAKVIAEDILNRIKG